MCQVGSTFPDVRTIVHGVDMTRLAFSGGIRVNVNGRQELANVCEWLEFLSESQQACHWKTRRVHTGFAPHILNLTNADYLDLY